MVRKIWAFRNLKKSMIMTFNALARGLGRRIVDLHLGPIYIIKHMYQPLYVLDFKETFWHKSSKSVTLTLR